MKKENRIKHWRHIDHKSVHKSQFASYSFITVISKCISTTTKTCRVNIKFKKSLQCAINRKYAIKEG